MLILLSICKAGVFEYAVYIAYVYANTTTFKQAVLIGYGHKLLCAELFVSLKLNLSM